MNILTQLGAIKRDNTATVYHVVYIAGKRVRINTGVSVDVSRWNEEKGILRGNSNDEKDINLIIATRKALINDIIVKYRLQNKELTESLLLQEYKNPSLRLDFFAFARAEIAERVKTNDLAETTAKQHYSSINKLQKFKCSLMFSEISHNLIENYRRWLKKNHNLPSTVHNAIKIFKTYTNIAIRKGIIAENHFTNVKVNRGTRTRVYLTEAELKHLISIYKNRTLDDYLHTTLRHFLFMCVTGLRFSDIVKSANFSNKINNTLVYIPHKTSRFKRETINLPLTSLALQLIADEGRKSGCFFDVKVEQVINRQLKEIAKLTGINKNITTHTGRHTFATLFLAKTKNIVVLQKLLGHSRITETMVYVHLADGETEREMQLFESCF